MSSINVTEVVPDDAKRTLKDVSDLVKDFARRCDPLESDNLYILTDSRTNARYCECHIRGSAIIRLSTIDVPLDPEEQSEYRANREIAEDHAAYERMKSDARAGRAFSNIVAEFIDSNGPDQPLQIIGGQHRFHAIKEALDKGVDEYHGVKVYFGLDRDQRLDVQLISNTNIAVSNDLLDRMYETVKGPHLRDWCQKVGLLEEQQDFADKRQRGQPITVRAARTFIYNYYKGREIDPDAFSEVRTTPTLLKTGDIVPEWEALKEEHSEMWDDPELKKAGEELATLNGAQQDYFSNRRKGDSNVDFAEKVSNYAVLSAWAYIAGMLRTNDIRLERHYALREQKNRDPLNVAALAKGRHKSDPENYRGLGYRTDPKERGRFVELFYLQAERGDGIASGLIDAAIKRYHAKQAVLEAREAEERV